MKSGKLLFVLIIALGNGAAYAVAPAGETRHEHEVSRQANHEGFGVLKGIDTVQHRVKIAHEPLPSLNWPAMTMWFPLRSQLTGIKEGDHVRFELQQEQDKWVITHIEHRK
jgi:Cu/Ag efflux protein CusF